ncbi:hypothetical protein Ocin01_18914 [Orchesella cincta]|uniref:Uncharacterized protein n=1 Tax=Orchesella cincta TaxID=48709 RepID=A0A1D2M465_ORCCI|nr:hypothetical protein Ocin01_18914 [Orchesella cincta]
MSVNINKRARRQCTFNAELAKDYPFLEKRSNLSDSEVYCKLCNHSFSIANSGRTQINNHINTEGHKKNERAQASSKQLNNFFPNLKAKKEDLDLAAREGTIAYHTVLHDHSFNSVSCTSKLLKSFYDQKFSCSKTKCERIVIKVLAPAAIEVVEKELANVNYINAAVDCSNHKNVKLMPVMIRYFTVPEGVKVRMIDIHSLPGETAEIITTAVLKTLKEFSLSDKLIGICADNTNTNFGGVNRKGKVNLFSWKEIENSLETFTAFTGSKLNENELLDEFACLNEYITKEKIADWDKKILNADLRWADLYREQMHQLNVFSLINNYWSAEKVNLSLETLNAAITMKVNMRMDCSEYYAYLKSDTELLKKIHSAEKYM